MFIFTDFVGSQLKESFEHYKRLKLQKRKVRNDRYYASRFYKVKVKTNNNLKNMMLSDKEIEG